MTDASRPEDQETVATPASPRAPGRRPPSVATGTLLAGRFRIVRFIARGGMGEVFEADDQVLGERVALKTIRADVADDARSMERFLREVHLARRVTHPNVCRIFDVFHHGDLAFLTMELLPGETLAERIEKRGRMTPGESLPLVTAMADALGAAHDAGIIHRDFKSGNVMLVSDPRRPGETRVVVTDFGLARARETEGRSAAPLTKSEAVLGTPDYMAPEQIEGRDLTPAADIYALGIVVYEMVTGEPPFRGETPLSVALKKLQEAPPSPRRAVPDLPVLWERTILRCLERRPADRFPSTAEAVRALRGERLPTGPAEKRRRRRSAAIATVALVLVALAGWAVQRARNHLAARAPAAAPPARAAASARPARRTIAVLGFKNLAGRPEAAWVSTALAEMLTTELAAGEVLRAVPSEDVARTRADLALTETDALGRETLGRVHTSLGADLVLLGSYLDAGAPGGGTLRLDLRLQDAAAGETIAVVSEKGTEADLDGIATRAGARLREKLGLAAVSPADAAAVKATLPGNPEAARLYAEGLAKLRLFEDDAARMLLERAVAADPKHALAHSALAEAWSGLGWDEKALTEAESAFVLSGGLSRETRLLIEGRYRSMSNEWDRAIEIYRSLFTFFPDNLDYGLLLARAQTRAGRPKDALATLDGLRASFPSPDGRIDLAEAETGRALSDYPRVEKAAMRAAELGRAKQARLLVASALLLESSARRNLGDAKAAIGKSGEARAVFEAAGDRAGVAATANDVGNSLYDLGDLPGAKKSYEEVLAIYRAIGNRRGQAGALDNMANVLGDQGDYAAARGLSAQALALYRQIGDKNGAAQTLNNMGTALFIQGDYRGARSLFEQALPLYRETGDRGGLAICLNNVGELKAGLGDVAGARAAFEEAFGIFRDSKQTSKSVYPMVGLAGTRLEAGDPAGARTMLEEGLKICRESGDRHESTYALAGLAAVALAEDRLPDARRLFEEARRVREELGEKDAAVALGTGLARVALAEGNAAAAVADARVTAEALGKAKLPDDEAAARVVLARALLAAGDRDASRAQLEKARPLVAAGQNDAVRREHALVAAQVAAASGDVGGARRALDSEIAAAKERGLVAFGLEAALARGQIERDSGIAADGRALLSAVEKDAAAKGFRLIAREARTKAG